MSDSNAVITETLHGIISHYQELHPERGGFSLENGLITSETHGEKAKYANEEGYNYRVGSKDAMYDKDLTSSYPRSHHLTDGRVFRTKFMNMVCGPKTRVIAVVDDKEFTGNQAVAIINARVKEDIAKFVVRHGKQPSAGLVGKFREEEKKAINDVADLKRVLRRKNHYSANELNDKHDSILRVYDNGEIEICDLYTGIVKTSFPVSENYIDLIIRTLVFEDKVEHSSEADTMLRASRASASSDFIDRISKDALISKETGRISSKTHKRVGKQIEDLEALLPFARRLDSVKLNEAYLKGTRRYAGLSDLANVDWDTITDEDKFVNVIVTPFYRSGVIPDDAMARYSAIKQSVDAMRPQYDSLQN